jgi:uncharacterized protein with PQ loop repeat
VGVSLDAMLGWVAMLITVVYTGVGLPMQIWKNHQRKSTEGLSLFLMAMMFVTACVWILYGLVKQPMDGFVVVANVPGALGGAAVLWQFVAYRSRKAN